MIIIMDNKEDSENVCSYVCMCLLVMLQRKKKNKIQNMYVFVLFTYIIENLKNNW